jgi:hypothetical protein
MPTLAAIYQDSSKSRRAILFVRKWQRQPSNHALIDALQSMIRDLPQSYILLDALDECTQRAELMEMFETMVG